MAESVGRLDTLIKNAIRAFERLGKVSFANLNTSLENIERKLGALGTTAGEVGVAMTEAFSGVTAGVTAATTAIGVLTTELNSAVAAAERLGATRFGGMGGGRGGRAGGGGGRAGGGGHGPFRIYGHAGPLRTHSMVSPGEALGLGAGGLAFLGLRDAAHEELALNMTLSAAGIDPRTAEGRARFMQLRGEAESISRGTMFAPAQVAAAMPTIAGLTGRPLDESINLMRPAIQFGEVERRIGQASGHQWGLEESAGAIIRMSHQLGVLEPAKMAGIADILIPLTQTSQRSPQEFENAMKYMAGMARTSLARGDIGPTEAAELAGLSTIFTSGGTAGTQINRMLLGMLDRTSAATSPAQAKRFARRLAVEEEMGLIDPRTHELFEDPVTHERVPLMLRHLAEFQQRVGPTEAMARYQMLGDIRGARGFQELSWPQVARLFDEIQRRQQMTAAAGGAGGILGESQEGIIGQLGVAWSNLRGILTALTQDTVPGLTSALKGLNAAFGSIRTFLSEHKDLAKTLGFGAEALGGLAVGSVLRRLLGWLGGGILGGAAGGGAAAVGGAAAGGLPGILGRLGTAALGATTALAGMAALYAALRIADVGPTKFFNESMDTIRGYLNKIPGFAHLFPDQSHVLRSDFALKSSLFPTGPGPNSAAGHLGISRVGRDIYGYSPDSPSSIAAALGAHSGVTPFRFRGRAMSAGELMDEFPMPGTDLGLLPHHGASPGSRGRGPGPTIINNGPFNISVKTETIAEIAEKLMAAIKSALLNALSHNSGVGAGVHESPWANGGGGVPSMP